MFSSLLLSLSLVSPPAAARGFCTSVDWADLVDNSGDFLHDKRLYIPREPDSDMSAQEQARRVMAQANASGYELHVTAAGHGQVLPGDQRPTIYRPDTVARCVREVRTSAIDDALVTLFDIPAYITRVTYTADESGARTSLSLVPLHTELS